MPTMPGYIQTRPSIPRLSAHRRGYTSRWQRQRAVFLAHNPLCVACRAKGEYVAANTVDHIQPHRGNRELFWDKDNWQALCEKCHNAKTARGL